MTGSSSTLPALLQPVQPSVRVVAFDRGSFLVRSQNGEVHAEPTGNLRDHSGLRDPTFRKSPILYLAAGFSATRTHRIIFQYYVKYRRQAFRPLKPSWLLGD
jgi:hypothetical protein